MANGIQHDVVTCKQLRVQTAIANTEPIVKINANPANDGSILGVDINSDAKFYVMKNTDITSGVQLFLGGNYIWVDNTGKLRIKTTNPSSDTDGTVVGTQA